MFDLQAELLAAAELTHSRALAAFEEASRLEHVIVNSALAEHASAPHGYWQRKHRAGLVLEAATAVLSAVLRE